MILYQYGIFLMSELPEYLLNIIKLTFKAKKSQKYIIEKLKILFLKSLNSDTEKIIRSILIISNGNIDEFNKILELELYKNLSKLASYGMEKLPNDIIQRINMDFKTRNTQKYIIKKLSTLYKMSINVGIEQLIRSILIIANGNIEEFDKIFESSFYNDPRDLIMYAMDKTKNETYYGINPFTNYEK